MWIQGRMREARVADDARQVLLAHLSRPADERVARGQRPGGGGEAEHGERRAVVGVHGVAHLGADQGLVAEVVVAGDLDCSGTLSTVMTLGFVVRQVPTTRRL